MSHPHDWDVCKVSFPEDFVMALAQILEADRIELFMAYAAGRLRALSSYRSKVTHAQLNQHVLTDKAHPPPQ